MKYAFLISLLVLISVSVFSQEEEECKHLITGALGYTYIPSGASTDSHEADGIFIPSIGLDYFYRLSPKLEVGLMADLELGEYVLIDKNLNRKNAIVFVLVGSYSLTKHINIFAGGGMEFEEHHNLGIIRLGTEYVFKLKKEWIIAPGVFFDLKEGTDTWSLSVAFGKEF